MTPSVSAAAPRRGIAVAARENRPEGKGKESRPVPQVAIPTALRAESVKVALPRTGRAEPVRALPPRGTTAARPVTVEPPVGAGRDSSSPQGVSYNPKRVHPRPPVVRAATLKLSET